MRSNHKILLICNSGWFVYNHRLNLLKGLRAHGYEVAVAASRDAYTGKIEAEGIPFIHIPIQSKGRNPFVDLALLYRFYRLFKGEKPSAILSFSDKPVIYGSLAAGRLNIPIVNNIAGLGWTFSRKNMLRPVVEWLYFLSQRRVGKVFFQNDDDKAYFLDRHLVKPEVAGRIPGSGVDLERFYPSPPSALANGSLRFMYVGRLLWIKGVGEYVEAARLLKPRYPQVEWQMLGFLGVDNPSAVSKEQMEQWEKEGLVTYRGASDRVQEVMKDADCVVLPSYLREGVPRSLLEAASMAKPIITTQSVGCRDAVDDGVTGFLVRPRDANDLAEKMERMIGLSREALSTMGEMGRKKVEREFDERFVIENYQRVIDSLVGDKV